MTYKGSTETEYYKVEKPAIEQFLTMGYEYVHGDDLAPAVASQERGSWRRWCMITFVEGRPLQSLINL